jgi:hypothetical protein
MRLELASPSLGADAPPLRSPPLFKQKCFEAVVSDWLGALLDTDY